MIKLTVTTPAPLSDEEKQKLAVAFNTQYKEKVAVDYRTDNALSASLIVFDGKNESSFTKLTVISSVELSPAQKQKVEDTFRKKYSNGILAEYLVDDSILGGLIVFDGKTVYDGSVKTKLENLKERLTHGND